MPFANAIDQWREGDRRLRVAPAHERPALEEVTDRIVRTLRRRLGRPFLTEELVDLYEAGTGWCLDVAVAVAPESPWAWDQRLIADAAFFHYLREASDYSGGRRDLGGG